MDEKEKYRVCLDSVLNCQMDCRDDNLEFDEFAEAKAFALEAFEDVIDTLATLCKQIREAEDYEELDLGWWEPLFEKAMDEACKPPDESNTSDSPGVTAVESDDEKFLAELLAMPEAKGEGLEIKVDDDIRAECRSLILLYRQVMMGETKEKRDFCADYCEPWSKNVHDAYRTNHWDALLAVRDRINEVTKADWRLTQPGCSHTASLGAE